MHHTIGWCNVNTSVGACFCSHFPAALIGGRGLRLTRYEFKLTAVKNNLSNFSIQNGDKKGVPLAIDACFSKSKELLWTLNLVVDEFELGTLCREKAYHYSIVSFSEID